MIGIMKNRIKKLTSEEIEILKHHFQSLKFNNDFDLVYETQVPNTGIVLLDGELELIKKKKIKSTVRPGNMLGIYKLLKNEPSELGCKVKGNSELLIIQKSDLMEALSDKNSELYAIIKENIDKT